MRLLAALLLLCSLAAAQSHSLNAEGSQAEAAKFLSDLVKLDTQDPPGNESRVAEYIKGVLAKEGITAELLKTDSGRDSVVARLKGDGSARPLLIMGHEDVVPVDR